MDWRVAAEFVGGSILAGWLVALGAKRLARTRGALNLVFAVVIVLVAIFMLIKSVQG